MKKITLLTILLAVPVLAQCCQADLLTKQPQKSIDIESADNQLEKASLETSVPEKVQNSGQEPDSLAAVVLVGGLGGAIFIAGCQIS